MENKSFLCGVCEGFYGKPWTTDQRKDLFHKMNRMGLNTYLYAPKDDYKHRLQWRRLYSDEEAAELKVLIQCAKDNNVDFVYALSPGLDMVFSEKADNLCLKAKLEQVKTFGCSSFALLFDDIDPDLCEEDREEFDSPAAAQCAITNAMNEHLGAVDTFLFCPTEYCTSRAVPDLASSDYLHTLGKRLHKNVDILWTGPKVVSRLLKEQELREVSKILQRPPVIWDNLHANDYDQTRLFLGPYDGRPPELVNCLRGVLSNPNCEYEANFVVIHTLAQWSKNTTTNFMKSETSGRASAECDMEQESGNESEEPKHSDDDNNVKRGYNPKLALEKAIQDWIPEFYQPRGSSNRFTAASTKEYSVASAKDGREAELADSEEGDMSAEYQNSSTSSGEESKRSDELGPDKEGRDSGKRKMEELEPLTDKEVKTICDMFYLPFQHGSRGVYLLKEAHWLVHNTGRVKDCYKIPQSEHPGEVREWYCRAMKFHDFYRRMAQMVDKFVNIPNRVLLYQLYNYISDMRSVTAMVNSHIKWHGMGKPEKCLNNAGEQEPWVHRGGLHAELRRILPMDGESDMFPAPVKDPPTTKVYTVRPFFPDDQADIYMVCSKTCDDGLDGSDIFPDYPELVADESVGGLITLCSQYCYVVEDGAGLCGYVVATPDVKEYQRKWKEEWMPRMHKKYPKPKTDKKEAMTVSQELIRSFYTDMHPIPDKLYTSYPAFVHLGVMSSRMETTYVAKQLLNCLKRSLKAAGACGVHTVLLASHINMMALHIQLGFEDVTDKDAPDEMMVLAIKL